MLSRLRHDSAEQWHWRKRSGILRQGDAQDRGVRKNGATVKVDHIPSLQNVSYDSEHIFFFDKQLRSSAICQAKWILPKTEAGKIVF